MNTLAEAMEAYMYADNFDSLGYFEKLKGAGVPEAQAKVQAESLREQFRRYDEASRRELATKEDILRLQNMIVDNKAEFYKLYLAGIALILTGIGLATTIILKYIP